MNRSSKLPCLSASAGFVALLLTMMAGSGVAVAGPELKVELEHTPETMPRTDEFVTYGVDVENTGTEEAAVGSKLKCTGPHPEKQWFPAPATGQAPTYAIEWLREGVSIPGAGGPWAEATPAAQFYTATAADQGKPIQCAITGTNAFAAGVYASPAVVVEPIPATAPPGPAVHPSLEARPWVVIDSSSDYGSADTAPVGTKRICKPPPNWTLGATYTYQWLRNASLILGAEGAEYQPVAADEGTNLQCRVTGTNAGGSVVGISDRSRVGSVSFVPSNLGNVGLEVQVQLSEEPVILQLDLPSGQETRARDISGDGWACISQKPNAGQPARAICTRPDQLPPGGKYPTVIVGTTVGPDAPDPAMAVAYVSGGGSPPDSTTDELHFGAPTPFDIETFTTKVANSLGNDDTRAGGHPFSASAQVELTTRVRSDGVLGTIERLRNAKTDLPPGFIGNPQAVPQVCGTPEAVFEDSFDTPTCPRSSIVGSIDFIADVPYLNLPIYMIKPERGAPVQLVFTIRVIGVMFTLSPRLRPADGYAISVDAPLAPKSPVLKEAKVTLCGYGVEVQSRVLPDPGSVEVVGCKQPGEPGANPVPFLTNPAECSATPPVTKLSIDSWENPNVFKSKEAVSPFVEGCENVPFDPTVSMRPTSQEADAPSGLDVSITMPTDGLESPTSLAQAPLKRAIVTLPQGMSVNPAAANGLATCSAAQIKLGTNDPVECPASSKVGSVEARTPILAEKLEGAVYLGKQGDNPFGTLLSLYLVIESKERGILIKLPGKVVADPQTGQLVSTFDNNPQAPISSVDLHFHSGARAALLTPPACGRYSIVSELSPWSAVDPDNPTPSEVRTSVSTFEVTSGPGGRPCPSDPPALEPRLNAGLTNPVAAAKGSFVLELTRDDGTQRFKALDVVMPPGLTGYLKGIPYCPDATLAGVSAAAGTGAAELAVRACPEASMLGKVTVGAGAGPMPYYADTGRAYLAGPYKGAPLSIAIVTPAVAGPFDLGSVAVRSAAYVDGSSGRITVKSDPIPTMLHGLALDVRDVRVHIDRPNFIAAPTNCNVMALGATVTGERGGTASLGERFQVGECAALPFKPKLSTRLIGGTKRGDNPRFRSILTAKGGEEANIRRVVVALPHSAFLDQAHINTVCTRVQFAQNACPRGSIYGKAKAWSPLVGYAVEGPVYLRSSSNPLPDLVVALKGPAYQPVELNLVGRIDSFRGGIRSTFDTVPDLPVSKFLLDMRGGAKGLLINSRNLCTKASRAKVRMIGQNGKVFSAKPVLANDCKVKRAKSAKRK